MKQQEGRWKSGKVTVTKEGRNYFVSINGFHVAGFDVDEVDDLVKALQKALKDENDV